MMLPGTRFSVLKLYWMLLFLLCNWRIERSELAILQFFPVYSQLITILLGLKTGMDAALFLFVIMCKDHADLHAVLILAYVPLERAPVFIFKAPLCSPGISYCWASHESSLSEDKPVQLFLNGERKQVDNVLDNVVLFACLYVCVFVCGHMFVLIWLGLLLGRISYQH